MGKGLEAHRIAYREPHDLSMYLPGLYTFVAFKEGDNSWSSHLSHLSKEHTVACVLPLSTKGIWTLCILKDLLRLIS